MIRRLGAADFRAVPWANGRGTTVELLRIDGPDGLTFRLSRASVVEAGAFSIFPGIDRSLTVVTGPGFDLEGEGIRLAARPLAPVAFPGDVPIGAVGVTAPSEDFNVMWARHLPAPKVSVVRGRHERLDAPLALYALGRAVVAGCALMAGELVIADQRLDLDAPDPVIVVRVPVALS